MNQLSVTFTKSVFLSCVLCYFTRWIILRSPYFSTQCYCSVIYFFHLKLDSVFPILPAWINFCPFVMVGASSGGNNSSSILIRKLFLIRSCRKYLGNRSRNQWRNSLDRDNLQNPHPCEQLSHINLPPPHMCRAVSPRGWQGNGWGPLLCSLQRASAFCCPCSPVFILTAEIIFYTLSLFASDPWPPAQRPSLCHLFPSWNWWARKWPLENIKVMTVVINERENHRHFGKN